MLVVERREHKDPEEGGDSSAQPVAQKKMVKVQCSTCNARYGIPEERLKGKVLKIRCKECQTIIEVRPPIAAKGVLERGTKQWFVVVKRERLGPFTEQEIRERFQRGEVKPKSYCWRRGFPQWERLKNIPDFAELQVTPAAAAEPPRDGPSTLPLPGLVTADPQRQDQTDVAHVDPAFMDRSADSTTPEPDLPTDPDANKQPYGVHLTGSFSGKADEGDEAFHHQLNEPRGMDTDPQLDDLGGESVDVETSAPSDSAVGADDAFVTEAEQEVASTAVRREAQESEEGPAAADLITSGEEHISERSEPAEESTAGEETSDNLFGDDMGSGADDGGLPDGEFDKHMKGQRHENSVLFSLGHLQNMAMTGTTKPKAASTPTEEKPSTGLTGLFDVRPVASPASPIMLPADAPKAKGRKMSTLVGMMVLGIILGIGLLVGGVYLLKPDIVLALFSPGQTKEVKGPLKVALKQKAKVKGEGSIAPLAKGPTTAPLAQVRAVADGGKQDAETPAAAAKPVKPTVTPLAAKRTTPTPIAATKAADEPQGKKVKPTQPRAVLDRAAAVRKKTRRITRRGKGRVKKPVAVKADPALSTEGGGDRESEHATGEPDNDQDEAPPVGAKGQEEGAGTSKGDGEGKDTDLDKLIDAATTKKLTDPKPEAKDQDKKPKGEKSAPESGANALPKALNQHQIASGMRRAQAAVNACGERFKRDGEVKIKATIDGTSQRIIKAAILGGYSGTPLGSCVLSAVKSATRFPKFSDPPLTLQFPFFIRIKTEDE